MCKVSVTQNGGRFNNRSGGFWKTFQWRINFLCSKVIHYYWITKFKLICTVLCNEIFQKRVTYPSEPPGGVWLRTSRRGVTSYTLLASLWLLYPMHVSCTYIYLYIIESAAKKNWIWCTFSSPDLWRDRENNYRWVHRSNFNICLLS